MLSGQAIRDISDIAAYQAAEDGRVPLVLWDVEKDIRRIPFLGSYVPAGWRTIDEPWFVDSTGFDYSGPALSFPGLVRRVTEQLAHDTEATFGYAIVEQGEFQLYVQAYIRDEAAPGQPAPSFGDVVCDSCGDVHGYFDECYEYGEDE